MVRKAESFLVRVCGLYKSQHDLPKGQLPTAFSRSLIWQELRMWNVELYGCVFCIQLGPYEPRGWGENHIHHSARDVLLHSNAFRLTKRKRDLPETYGRRLSWLNQKECEGIRHNILVQSNKTQDHISDLREMFSNIRKVRLYLKAKKCAFDVTVNYFLSYLITLESIKPE